MRLRYLIEKEVHLLSNANVVRWGPAAIAPHVARKTNRYTRTAAGFAVILLATAACPPTRAQVLVDTLFSWQGYNRTSTCGLQIFTNPEPEKDLTVVLKELGVNSGEPITSDAQYVVEQIGRSYSFDPTSAEWVFRWGSYSFAGAEDGSKELLLRARFRRNKNGNLSLPSWRIVTSEEAERSTDRLFR